MESAKYAAHLIAKFGKSSELTAQKLNYLSFLFDWGRALSKSSMDGDSNWEVKESAPVLTQTKPLQLNTDFRVNTNRKYGISKVRSVTFHGDLRDYPLSCEEMGILMLIGKYVGDCSFNTLLNLVHSTTPMQKTKGGLIDLAGYKKAVCKSLVSRFIELWGKSNKERASWQLKEEHSCPLEVSMIVDLHKERKAVIKHEY